MSNIYRFAGIILLVSLLTIFISSSALAFDLRQGETVTVASGEVVNDDLYIASGDIIIDGTVNGDIFAIGRSITINGRVNGGVSFGGQTATINDHLQIKVKRYVKTVQGSILSKTKTVDITSPELGTYTFSPAYFQDVDGSVINVDFVLVVTASGTIEAGFKSDSYIQNTYEIWKTVDVTD